MNLNDYLNYINDPLASPKARVVIVQSGGRTSLQHSYQQRGAFELRLSDLVAEKAWLPMPDEVFKRIAEKFALDEYKDKSVIVLGVSGYLTLLAEGSRRDAIIALRQWVDAFSNSDTVCLLEKDEGIISLINEVFTNPRYRSGKQLIEITQEMPGRLSPSVNQAKVMLVNAEFTELIPDSCSTFQGYLRHNEDYPGEDAERRIVVESKGRELAGLSTDVHQVVSLQDFAKEFYDVDDSGLSDDALQWMCEQGKKNQYATSLAETLKSVFFEQGDIVLHALRSFVNNRQEAEQQVLWWVIKKIAPANTYLSFVTQLAGVDASNFRSAYVASAFERLDEALQYSDERRLAIEQAGVQLLDTDIKQFIEHCKDQSTNQVAPWLNCGTNGEKAELLRRCFADGITSNAVKGVYPALATYLNDAPVFGNASIQAYFDEYRQLKTTNQITDKFYQKAANQPIDGVKTRDTLIQQYSNDEECALLVVDAMGAEWLPMLVGQAREQNIGIESVNIGLANLPTSTAFNTVNWSDSRRLPDVKRFDNIAHNGAEAHEKRTDEENLMVSLDVIRDEIIPRVAEALTKHEKVLVTADHGSSRLAALAWRSEPRLAQTLKFDEGAEIEDWRFMKPPASGIRPSEMQETLDGQYWVVRGYNRLPKRGGGQGFELHGGMTLEERLVPVVLFSRSDRYVPQEYTGTPKQQMVENDDFDL